MSLGHNFYHYHQILKMLLTFNSQQSSPMLTPMNVWLELGWNCLLAGSNFLGTLPTYRKKITTKSEQSDSSHLLMYMTSITQTEWFLQINMAQNSATQKKKLCKLYSLNTITYAYYLQGSQIIGFVEWFNFIAISITEWFLFIVFVFWNKVSCCLSCLHLLWMGLTGM